MNSKFNSKNEARDFALEQLENKYDEPFSYKNNVKEVYETYPTKKIYKTSLFANDNNLKTNVWVSSNGELKDNFAQHYFEPSLVKPIKDIFSEMDNFVLKKVTLSSSLTEKKFTAKDSATEYFDTTNSEFSISIENNTTVDNSTLSDYIHQLLDKLYPFKKFRLKIYQNDTLQFFYDYNVEKKELSLKRIEAMLTEQNTDNSYLNEVFNSFSK